MKKAILMMTFGSPEEISFEGVAEFFTNIRRGVRPRDHEIQTLYDNYVLIGGTPLQRITREEVARGGVWYLLCQQIFSSLYSRCDQADGN